MDRRQHEHETDPHEWFAGSRRRRRRPIHLTLVFDAHCPWSHAVGPMIEGFLDDHDRLPVEVVHGSLFADARIRPIGQIGWLPSTIASVAGLTDAHFGAAYRQLAEQGTFVMDSGAAAVGFVALRSIAPDLALPLAMAMHRAFFHDGRSLSDARTYAAIAAAHDISIERVNERLVDPTIRRIARYEAGRALGLGITTYPALLLHVRGGTVPITSRLRSVEQLAEALREYEHSLSAGWCPTIERRRRWVLGVPPS